MAAYFRGGARSAALDPGLSGHRPVLRVEIIRAESFRLLLRGAIADVDPSQAYQVLDRGEAASRQDALRDFALEVLVGLSERPKRLPSSYFYDDEGSRLFQQIMGLYEYYPTGCEREILERRGADILRCVEGRPCNIVDLGAGDGAKTIELLRVLDAQGADARYVPIDISEGAMRSCVTAVRAALPKMPVAGLVSDYVRGIEWLAEQEPERTNLLLFLGSNLGNFDKPNARAFLRRLWSALKPGDYALIGFDLKKDIEILLSAYNDSQGVTARFNLNLLERINRELGGDFDLDKWRHFGTYDVLSGAMKSYLVSREEQYVHVEALQNRFHFLPWEAVHTEYSYKYLESDIDDLAKATGYRVEQRFYDRRSYFVDALWRVEKQSRSPAAN